MFVSISSLEDVYISFRSVPFPRPYSLLVISVKKYFTTETQSNSLIKYIFRRYLFKIIIQACFDLKIPEVSLFLSIAAEVKAQVERDFIKSPNSSLGIVVNSETSNQL